MTHAAPLLFLSFIVERLMYGSGIGLWVRMAVVLPILIYAVVDAKTRFSLKWLFVALTVAAVAMGFFRLVTPEPEDYSVVGYVELKKWTRRGKTDEVWEEDKKRILADFQVIESWRTKFEFDGVGIQIMPNDVRFSIMATRTNYRDKVDLVRRCMHDVVRDNTDLEPSNAKIRVYDIKGYQGGLTRVDPWNDPNDTLKKRDRIVFSEEPEFDLANVD
jgi:hypothetical protein